MLDATIAYLEDISWAELGGAGAELGQVALMLGVPTLHAGRLRPARLEVTTLARGARGVGPQPTCGRIAARVVAMLAQPAVALLARLHKPVAAHGTVEQGARSVAQAIVHPVLEGQGQVLQAKKTEYGLRYI